jgi:HD-GYP domain-containing protein (c-di-GMP phosphodiesterase class II)
MRPEELRFEQALRRLGVTGAAEDRLRQALEPTRIFDEDTYLHSLRNAVLSATIAEHTHLNARALLWAGALHDDGKRLISRPEIVRITGTFTEEDKAIMDTHVMLGFDSLVAQGFLFTAHVMKYHHRFGPHPYPDPLPDLPSFWQGRDREFRVYGRVLALADYYDALMYRKNDKFAGVLMTPEEKKQRYIAGNLDEERVVRLLIEKGVLIF